MTRLLHDPANGPLPTALAWANRPTLTDFHSQPGHPLGVKCPRCGRYASEHVWQMVDDLEAEQEPGNPWAGLESRIRQQHLKGQ